MRARRAAPILRTMDSHHTLPADRGSSNEVTRTMLGALLTVPLAVALILGLLGLAWLWVDLLV